MTFAVTILRRAARSLSKLPPHEYQRVRDAIRPPGEDPHPPGCKKLAGRDGWRIRIGRYQVIYEIRDADLVVLDAGGRKGIYG